MGSFIAGIEVIGLKRKQSLGSKAVGSSHGLQTLCRTCDGLRGLHLIKVTSPQFSVKHRAKNFCAVLS